MTLHVSNLASDASANTASRPAAGSVRKPGLYRNFFKRALDLLLVAISLPLVLPAIALLALTVAVLTGGSPFYTQLRLGRNGRIFRMWKLRTMVKDADAILESYLEQDARARDEWDTTQKLRNDPRITVIGRALRKTSLDELPQLFNVLNGTMSLVGPRPMMVGQEKYYNATAYFNMRPGITGLWQVSDRNDCYFADRALYDDSYDRVLSLKTDIGILFRTVGVVMRATGH